MLQLRPHLVQPNKERKKFRKGQLETHKSIKKKKKKLWGFPSGSVVKNPPANSGDKVQSPVQENSTRHRAVKPVPHITSLRSGAWELHYWEACAPQPESSPHSLKLEKSLSSNEDPAQSPQKRSCKVSTRNSIHFTHPPTANVFPYLFCCTLYMCLFLNPLSVNYSHDACFTSKYFRVYFLKIRISSYKSTKEMIKIRKLTLTQYYFLIYTPYSDLINSILYGKEMPKLSCSISSLCSLCFSWHWHFWS